MIRHGAPLDFRERTNQEVKTKLTETDRVAGEAHHDRDVA